LLANLNLLGGTVVACLVALDIAYSMYVNSTTSSFDITKSRVFDENIWVSELYPKVYYPTERNFALHKPNVKVSGEPFGNLYRLPMLDSPILTSAVLERSGVTIRINEAGFRESSDIGAAEIFTLGDSFTFGWGVNEEESWPGRLEARLERTIYNLGIHDASPRQEVELLRYVLRRYAEGLRLSTVLWMIYEGNDLEDDYSDVVQRPDMSGTIPLSRGTLVEALERMMWTIKRQSVIHRFQRGQITWRPPSGDGADPYVVDGVRLVYPLYHSERLGPRLFSGTYVDLAGKSADYVDGHWNRSALE
jgi:hypothetical protein